MNIPRGLPAMSQGQDAPVVGVEGLETVTATARKREELLQDVPIVATAFSPDDLNRLGGVNASNLNLAVPNLTIVRVNTLAHF